MSPLTEGRARLKPRLAPGLAGKVPRLPAHLAAWLGRVGRPSSACGTAHAPQPAPSGTPGCRLREEPGPSVIHAANTDSAMTTVQALPALRAGCEEEPIKPGDTDELRAATSGTEGAEAGSATVTAWAPAQEIGKEGRQPKPVHIAHGSSVHNSQEVEATQRPSTDG